MKNNDKILVAISNLTCFYAIENDLIDIKKRAAVDIVVIESYSAIIRKSVEKTIKDKGFKLKSLSEIKGVTYKILLEPYIITSGIKAEFRIRYEYGVSPASLKPDPVYTPEWNLPYDAEICYSPIGANILSIYTKPYIVKPLQFNNFTLHKMGKKINLLVLFTWGDVSVTHKLAQIKEQLGDAYNVIVKSHHGIEYLSEYKDAERELKESADEYYDASANVNELFSEADVVLTDDSSAVFTAIYLGIPTAIFSESTSDYRNMNGIKAAHFSLLIEPKRISYTNKIENINKVIESALKNIDTQNRLRSELYSLDTNETLSDVVDKYLHLNRKEEPYYIIKDLLLERKSAAEATIQNQDRLISDLSIENDTLRNHITSFMGVRRSARLLAGNIKRRISKNIN